MAQAMQKKIPPEKGYISLYYIFCSEIKCRLNIILEKDIIDKYGKMGDIMLAGDFNARTGSEPDYCK